MFLFKKKKELLSQKIRIYEYSLSEYYAFLEKTYLIKSLFKTVIKTEWEILRKFELNYCIISYNMKEKNRFHKYNFNKIDWLHLGVPDSSYQTILHFPGKNSHDLRSLVLDYLDKYPFSEKEYIDKEIEKVRKIKQEEQEKQILFQKDLPVNSGNLSLIDDDKNIKFPRPKPPPPPPLPYGVSKKLL